ncbi:alpha/beta hydrolase fold domain-containing protein [Hymenobacter sp. HD11105]|jgi:acetyl esterase/lipase
MNACCCLYSLLTPDDVADLRGLAPVTIIGAEIDPLQTEGQQLRDKLLSAGVAVSYQLTLAPRISFSVPTP